VVVGFRRFTVITSLGMVALGGCLGGRADSSGTGSGGAGGGSAGTAGTTDTGGTANTGGTPSTGGTMSPGGCPALLPEPGEECDVDIPCSYEKIGYPCDGALPAQALCVAGRWHILRPVTCAPLPPTATCNPVGHWQANETGPYEPEDRFPEYQQGPFDIVLSVTPDGIVYMDEYNGELSPDGCTLSGFGRIEADCEELQDDTFCTFVDRIFELDFTQVPATGTVTLELSGEGDALATAPLEAVAVP
jgi:hypothetical protein